MAHTPETEVRITALQLALNAYAGAPGVPSSEQVVEDAEAFEAYINRASEPKDFDS